MNEQKFTEQFMHLFYDAKLMKNKTDNAILQYEVTVYLLQMCLIEITHGCKD